MRDPAGTETRRRAIDPTLAEDLRCAVCGASLSESADSLSCSDTACGATFPIIDGVPLLIDERESVFRIQEIVSAYRDHGSTRAQHSRGIERFLGVLPRATSDAVSRQEFARFAEQLLATCRAPRVLVVGGGKLGEGMAEIRRSESIRFVDTDVYIGPTVLLVCDGHRLPFRDGLFDGVIIQAVLEHVADPVRVVQEIHRVLEPEGLVYAESPFLYPVHEGRYDFTRFTQRGHRRLFRHFHEIESGPVQGPGTMLGVAYKYFLRSFARSRTTAAFVHVFASLTGFWLKYLDWFLVGPRANEAATGFYFLGRRADEAYSDRSIVEMYE